MAFGRSADGDTDGQPTSQPSVVERPVAFPRSFRCVDERGFSCHVGVPLRARRFPRMSVW
ncbi:MAG: hypothetical protein D6725_14125 [Planctomycetota bacterium]|nr:MAG: hypothetical protein D6725_14125 [Planctomycetota bacterium]